MPSNRDGNKIGDEGIQWLSSFTKLTRLSLPSTKITVKGVLEITRLHLNKLKYLVLSRCVLNSRSRRDREGGEENHQQIWGGPGNPNHLLIDVLL